MGEQLSLSEPEREVVAWDYAYERASRPEDPMPRQEKLAYLTEKVGVSPEEAERILADDDLFLTGPGSRYGFAAEEAIQVWGEAQEKLYHLSEAAWEGEVFGNVGVSMLLSDATSRAAKLRRRAEERVREASGE